MNSQKAKFVKYTKIFFAIFTTISLGFMLVVFIESVFFEPKDWCSHMNLHMLRGTGYRQMNGIFFFPVSSLLAGASCNPIFFYMVNVPWYGFLSLLSAAMVTYLPYDNSRKMKKK